MAKWKKVYHAEQMWKAEIVKSILEENELSPVLINKKESATQIGFYEVHVLLEQVMKALKIINDDISFE
ncbi:MAG: DUF2007 domain-containing protein [Cyclobacteriaceae bacterium]|nr:DUF2007 domain-containing protein [Cyclobacteriaceae bacterium]